MDLLDFAAEPLYFDEPLPEGVLALIEAAGAHYGEAQADADLVRAAALAPDHLLVLVALYRNHFYRHRAAEAEAVAWRAIGVAARRLDLPADGRELDATKVETAARRSMTLTRFYLSALKAVAYLRMRGGDLPAAVALLETLTRVDEADRLGSRALLDIALAHGNEAEADAD